MAGVRLGDVHRRRDNARGDWKMCMVTGRVESCVLAAFDRVGMETEGLTQRRALPASPRRHCSRKWGSGKPWQSLLLLGILACRALGQDDRWHLEDCSTSGDTG
jgi:hypothetical protein